MLGMNSLSAQQNLLIKGRERLNATITVLEEYHQTRSIIHRLEKTNQTNVTALMFLQNIREGLEKLVPKTFMALYKTEKFPDLIRYLKTVALRTQRALIDIQKDQTKAKQVTIFENKLNNLLSELTPMSSEKKRNHVEEFFWMIEEYKISIFAQEIKTAIPVSKKRLENKLKKIEQML